MPLLWGTWNLLWWQHVNLHDQETRDLLFHMWHFQVEYGFRGEKLLHWFKLCIHDLIRTQFQLESVTCDSDLCSPLCYTSGGETTYLNLWNSIPVAIRLCNTVTTFKICIKTYLFNLAYPMILSDSKYLVLTGFIDKMWWL